MLVASARSKSPRMCRLRILIGHFSGTTTTPQCPFPDPYLGSVINAISFDAVYVQVSHGTSNSLRYC